MQNDEYLRMQKLEKHHWWFTARRKILKSLLQKNLKSPITSTKILEIGCGTGGNLSMLKTFGEVTGADMSSLARKIAKDTTNVNITNARLPNHVPFDCHSFNLICMFDVLEHIEEDEDSLKALSPLLKEKGKIILTVPAYQWLYSSHDKSLHHKRRYRLKQLVTLCQSAGFNVEEKSYFNTLLFPLAISFRAFDKLIGNKQSSGVNLPPNNINQLLGKIFSFEAKILRYISLPFGLSIYIILSKNGNQTHQISNLD